MVQLQGFHFKGTFNSTFGPVCPEACLYSELSSQFTFRAPNCSKDCHSGPDSFEPVLISQLSTADLSLSPDLPMALSQNPGPLWGGLRVLTLLCNLSLVGPSQ